MQLDLIDYGNRMRDQALAQVKANAGDWFNLAKIEARALKDLYPDEEFLAEWLRFKIVPTIGPAGSANVWGSLVRELVKEGVLIHTGKYGEVLGEKGHRREARIYRYSK